MNTIGELVAHAKANPGKLNMSTLGGFSDLMSEMFKRAAGLDMLIVPYRGAAEASWAWCAATRSAERLPGPGAAGRGRPGRVLAVTSPQRSTAMPEVPTLHESGFGFDVINVIGILAPGATPKPIVYRLTTEIARIMRRRKAASS